MKKEREGLPMMTQKINQPTDNSSVEGFASAIFVNTAIDFIRHEKRINRGRMHPKEADDDLEKFLDEINAETVSSGPTPEEEYAAKERLRIVLASVAQLNAQAQRLLELKFLCGLSEKEIARELGFTTRDQVAGRIKRILETLRQDVLRDAE
jgi:RNA polymerase sigma factor (sigma-70 family)